MTALSPLSVLLSYRPPGPDGARPHWERFTTLQFKLINMSSDGLLDEIGQRQPRRIEDGPASPLDHVLGELEGRTDALDLCRLLDGFDRLRCWRSRWDYSV